MLPSSTLASDEPDSEAPASDSSGSAVFPFAGDGAAEGQSPVGPASLPLSHSAAIAAADAYASPPPMPPRDPPASMLGQCVGRGRRLGEGGGEIHLHCFGLLGFSILGSSPIFLFVFSLLGLSFVDGAWPVISCRKTFFIRIVYSNLPM